MQKIYIVDDDPAIRESLQYLLQADGYQVELFACGSTFLQQCNNNMVGCVILDLRMPVLSGLEVQTQMKNKCCTLPIIFLTGHGDTQTAITAMKRGAVDFFTKPFRTEELLAAVHQATNQSQSRYMNYQELASINARLDRLTDRELEVMNEVLTGKLNKVIAADLGIGMKTVEIHRSRVMKKMGVRTLADLVKTMFRYEELSKSCA